MNKIILYTGLFLTLTNCSIKKEKKDISYNLTQNGCSTGVKQFSSKDDMCEALKDHAFNNFCATELRRASFKSNACPGDFDSSSTQIVSNSTRDNLPSDDSTIETTITEIYEYKYGFSTPSCSTGEKSFSNKIDYCNSLRNEEENNFCAEDEREALFIENQCALNPFI